MKRLTHVLFVLLAVVMSGTALAIPSGQNNFEGSSWRYQDGQITHLAVFIDGYFSHSRYDVANKNFISTRGGTYQVNDGALAVQWQYDTDKASAEADLGTWLGQIVTFTAEHNQNALQTDITGAVAQWERIQEQPTALTGVWRMSGRMQGDEVSDHPLRDRRTLKILTGNRFQWVAINIATGAFSGTGGGTYTFENGKYTENIEFFSRDGSRVGAALTFDGNVQDGKWHHSGLSSTGNPIYEIWSRMDD